MKKISDDVIDFDFSTGSAVLITNLDELVQSIYLTFKQNKGQWWLGKNFGIPYINQSNKKGIAEIKTSDVSLYEAEYNKVFDARSEIIGYKYVRSSLSSDRIYSAVIELKTIYGTTSLEV